MDRSRIYEYLALSRARILDWARPLGPEMYARTFPIGPGSLARTLTHMLISEWYYVKRMLKEHVPPYAHWPIRDEQPPALAALEAAWSDQARATRAALLAPLEWSTPLEYPINDDDGKPIIITATPDDIYTQLVLHEVHHRAQVMNMLRQLGVPAQDVDFNTLMYQRRSAT